MPYAAKAEELATVLRKLRVAQGYSIRQLSRESGVSHSYIALLESQSGGKESAVRPSPETLFKLGSVLGNQYQRLMSAAGYLSFEAEDAVRSRAREFFTRLLQQGAVAEPREDQEPAPSSPGPALAQLIRDLDIDPDVNPAYQRLLEAFGFTTTRELNEAIRAYEDVLRGSLSIDIQQQTEWMLGRLYSQRGDFSRAGDHLQRAFGAANLDAREAARLRSEIGWNAYLRAHFEEATAHFGKALELEVLDGLVEYRTACSALDGLATVSSILGRSDEAKRHVDRLHTLAVESGDRRLILHAQFTLAMWLVNTGGWPEADRIFRRLVPEAEVVASPAMKAIYLNEYARLLWRRGAAGEAKTLASDALRLNREQDLRWGRAHSLELLGEVHLSSGDTVRSLSLLIDAHAEFVALGSPLRVFTTICRLAAALLILGDSAASTTQMTRALHDAEDQGFLAGGAVAARLRGLSLVAQGDVAQALTDLERSLALLRGTHFDYEEAASLLGRALVRASSGSTESNEDLRRARTIFAHLDCSLGIAICDEFAGLSERERINRIASL